MAKLKPLSAAINPGMNAINNSGTAELSKKMPVESIETMDVFQQLMPFNQKTVDAIASDMAEHGYDNSQPVHVWKEKGVLIDGYQRLAGAKQSGLYDIPVFEHSFQSDAEALTYAIKLQVNRRNLDDAGIVMAIEKLDNLKKSGRPSIDSTEEKGRSSEQLADLIGTNSRKVERVRSILKDGDEETVKALKQGDLSINKAYNKVHPVKQDLPEKTVSAAVSTEKSNKLDIDSSFSDFESAEADPLTDNSIEEEKKQAGGVLPGKPSKFEELLTAPLQKLAEYLHQMQISTFGDIDENRDTLTVEEWKEVLRSKHE